MRIQMQNAGNNHNGLIRNVTKIITSIHIYRSTPPRKKCKLKAPILAKNCWRTKESKALVNMLANWEWDFDQTGNFFKVPQSTFSRTKWEPISICFVCLWKDGFKAMAIVTWLSQKTTIGGDWNCKSQIRW